MSDDHDFIIDCRTCIGVGTTACNECVMTHLLANDDGPIDYVPVELRVVPRRPTPDEAAVAMFQRVGLVSAVAEYVTQEEFDLYGSLIR